MGRPRKNPEPIVSEPIELPDIYRPVDPDAREQQMVSFAMDLAERKLRDGTASSQIIEHYLKIGSTKAKLEYDLLREELELKKAKTEAIQSARTEEEKYQRAIEAMRIYSGQGEPEEYYE